MTNTTDSHIPTIVYVEDNAGDARLLEEALRARGHATQLLVIEQGAMALRYFKVKESARDLPPPHCILLDSYLPAVTGIELLRFIRGSRVYDDTPVYIFAAESQYRDFMHDQPVAKESFISKSDSWDGFLQLADMLMRSAAAKQDDQESNRTDSKREAHAQADLGPQDGTKPRDANSK